MSKSNEPDNLVAFLEGSVAKYPDRPLFGTKNSWTISVQVSLVSE